MDFKVDKGTLHHIHIEPSENGGASVETHLRKHKKDYKSGKLMPEYSEYDTEKHLTTHSTDKEVGNHVAECLRCHRGESGSPTKKSSPSVSVAKHAAMKVREERK